MHSAIKKALMLAQNRRQYQTGGVPDDASQEAFLHEQLQGSAPQYDPQGGLETAKSAAQSLAGMTTPGAIADAAGYLGGPSALQNLRDQNYFDAALQLAAVVPGVGPLSKAAKLSKEAEEAANIKRYIERTSPDLSVARRYKTTEKAKQTLKPGQRLVHTMIEDPPVIPPIKRAEGGPIDDYLTGSVELGQPDEASQEAFLQEQLQGSAPQYTPEEGMLTGKRAGLMAAGFAPGAGITTAAGQFPTAEGGKEPSMAEDWRKGEYLSAGLKGLGAAGDIAYGVPLVGPAVGAAMKAPLVAKLASISAPLYHGSKIKDLVELARSERGPLGPGVYTSTFPNIAERYAGQEGKVYEVPHEGLDIYRGEGHRTDEEYFGYKNDKKRLIESVPEEHKETIIPLIEKMSGSDGYPLYQRIKGILGSDEAAQGLFRKAGFHGISGQIDGPETVIFDPIKIKTAKSEPNRITNPIGMYSAAAEAARALPQEKGTLQQMLATMKGVTPEELHWSGVHEAFAGKPTVTREELAKHFEERLPGVSETVLVNEPIKGNGWETIEGATKFGEYTLPGGENYREVVLRLPENRLPSPEIMYKSGDDIRKKADLFVDGGWSKDAVEAAARFVDDSGSLENGLKTQDALVARGYGYTPAQKESGQILRSILEHHRKKVLESNVNSSKLNFRSQHWDQPNVLSHLRMSDRTGPEGEKILHLEELQSDWGQKGRKEGFKGQPDKFEVGYIDDDGYRSYETFSNENEANNFHKNLIQNGMDSPYIKPIFENESNIPPAPYVASPEGKHTLSWVDLGLKRALKEAAEGGYDKLIWTPGEEHVQRYNLRNHFNNISYDPEEKKLSFVRHGSHNWENVPGNIEKNQIAEHIGVDAAERLLNTKPNPLSGNHILEGEDLEVGGEGMKKFYDKIVPSQLQKIVKKLDKDAKVQLGGYQLTKDQQNVPVNAHVIQITPKMREAILKGFSAYAAGGAVKPRNSSHLDPIIQRGMDAVRRVKSQNGGSRTIIRRKDYEPVRGIRFHYPNEVSSDQPDIQDYQMKRHAHEFIGSPEPEVPQRGVYVDAPLFGGRNKLFSMSYYYQPLVEKALNLIYGQKTTPFYYIPETAPIARAVDAYETAKFVQRDPSSWKNYLGVPGTLMGLNKFGAPAVVAGAVAARDPEKIEQKEPEKLGPFDYGTTPEIISHQKGEPEIMQQAKPLEYAKGGEIHDDFESLMAEVDELLEKFKD